MGDAVLMLKLYYNDITAALEYITILSRWLKQYNKRVKIIFSHDIINYNLWSTYFPNVFHQDKTLQHKTLLHRTPDRVKNQEAGR